MRIFSSAHERGGQGRGAIGAAREGTCTELIKMTHIKKNDTNTPSSCVEMEQQSTSRRDAAECKKYHGSLDAWLSALFSSASNGFTYDLPGGFGVSPHLTWRISPCVWIAQVFARLDVRSLTNLLSTCKGFRNWFLMASGTGF
jgi:hypothetical protein